MFMMSLPNHNIDEQHGEKRTDLRRVVIIKQVALLIARIYIVVALVIAALFSLITFSVIPILLLGVYLYLWWRPVRPVIHLLLDYFIYFALGILFSPWLGHYSLFMALPVLLLVHDSLLKTAAHLYHGQGNRPRQVTDFGIFLVMIAGLVLMMALIVQNLTLTLVAVIGIIYLLVLQIIAWRRIPLIPVEAQIVEQRMVAGNKDIVHVHLKVNMNNLGGNIFLKSSYSWLKVHPDFISLRDAGNIDVDITLAPSLAGPSEVKLIAFVTDRWGMLQYRCEITPIKLYVIPRARYAAWLAQKYLEGTRQGSLPLVAALQPFQLQNARQGGVEYYGTKPYQSGDSLKSIDWKHSLKFNELVSKDFREFYGRAALVLVNLVAADAEEGDKLASNIITTALSLARENIPAVIASYNNEQVSIVSPLLSYRNLVAQALKVAQNITYLEIDKRYLRAPDISRLRANLMRTRSGQSDTAAVLARLFQIEYRSLAWNAQHNPVTEALKKASLNINKEFNIVVISQHNHDTDALAFSTFYYRQQGHTVIDIAGIVR